MKNLITFDAMNFCEMLIGIMNSDGDTFNKAII